mgnify:CR=1 FL=1
MSSWNSVLPMLRFVAASQSAFMILLFSLMLFVSFRDVGRWFRDNREEARIERTYIQPVFPAGD